MTVEELQSYLTKHCSPDWEVVMMDDAGTRAVAYADRSGRERICILVPQPGQWSSPAPYHKYDAHLTATMGKIDVVLLSAINDWFKRRGLRYGRIGGSWWRMLEMHNATSSAFKLKRNRDFMRNLLWEMEKIEHAEMVRRDDADRALN